MTVLIGCTAQDKYTFFHGNEVSHYEHVAHQATYPYASLSDGRELDTAPQTIQDDDGSIEYEDLTLDQAVQQALANTQVLQDLGGTILRNPEIMQTNYSVALQRSDPRFGIEAALSAFDAQFLSTNMFERNDRPINNQFLGGGTREFQQDLLVHHTELSKIAATGTLFSARHIIDYDANNAPGNFFRSAWQTIAEAEVRHPLLQGSGTQFNRLAGPFALPGLVNGVLIARVNTDISEADFELGLRDFISDVENAYWDLYFAYRDLNAKVAARDKAYVRWQFIVNDRDRHSADQEALAREQYFRFQEDVENALTGTQVDGTRTRNGTSGGTFRGQGGVQVCERRLRLLMGGSINNGRLIRPITEPQMAPVRYDWGLIAAEAVARRPELKKQHLRVKRADMELEANKNFLSPRLDAVGRYRFRGFGDDLVSRGVSVPPGGDPDQARRWDKAYGNLFSGDYQEWGVGLELTVPLGYRRAHAAVQAAELLLAKECALLREQERQVVHDLSNAVAEMDRAYKVMETNLNRYEAARQLLHALETNIREGRAVELDRELDAQRRLAEAESRYFLSQAQYALAVKNVNFEKGSLLDYHELYVNDDFTGTMLATESPKSLPLSADGQSDLELLQPVSVEQPADTSKSSGSAEIAVGHAGWRNDAAGTTRATDTSAIDRGRRR